MAQQQSSGIMDGSAQHLHVHLTIHRADNVVVDQEEWRSDCPARCRAFSCSTLSTPLCMLSGEPSYSD
jgi:hypothetical protein